MAPDAVARFRDAVAAGDADAIAATLAPDVRLHTPTRWRPIEGRDRARALFGILVDLFEDFGYTHVFAAAPLDADTGIASTHALAFRCRVGDETIEGIDLIDVDHDDQIAVFKVYVRPLAGLQALAAAVSARFTGPPG
jgi:hypothetical protein